jgi:hypothetical protein
MDDYDSLISAVAHEMLSDRPDLLQRFDQDRRSTAGKLAARLNTISHIAREFGDLTGSGESRRRLRELVAEWRAAVETEEEPAAEVLARARVKAGIGAAASPTPHSVTLASPQGQQMSSSMAVVEPLGASRWPWGEHDTELLQQLAEAARQWWSTYDPADPATAPTNAAVRTWLIERKVPRRVAEVMAQMLRADGLPPGPRPRPR